jgi:hypothetical protein
MLEKHEVFQALHSSVTGGKGPIDRIRDELVPLGFGELDGSQIEKAAIAVAGGDPRKPLQEQISHALAANLLDRTARSLALTIEFLSADASVPHLSWLPYAGVIPALARFLSLHPSPHPRNRELLVRWFWRGTLTREHRPDNHLDRPKWKAIDEDEHGSVQRLLKLLSHISEESLPSTLEPLTGGRSARRFTEYISLASLEPKVLTGEARGQDVPVASLLEHRHGFFEIEPLPGSNRTIASLLLHPADLPLDPFLLTGLESSLLASHGLDEPSVRAWAAGDRQALVSLRSAKLLTHLRRFLTEAAGLRTSDHDRQPLDAYFAEDGA